MSASDELPMSRRAARDAASATGGGTPTGVAAPSDATAQPLTRRRLRELRAQGIDAEQLIAMTSSVPVVDPGSAPVDVASARVGTASAPVSLPAESVQAPTNPFLHPSGQVELTAPPFIPEPPSAQPVPPSTGPAAVAQSSGPLTMPSGRVQVPPVVAATGDAPTVAPAQEELPSSWRRPEGPMATGPHPVTRTPATTAPQPVVAQPRAPESASLAEATPAVPPTEKPEGHWTRQLQLDDDPVLHPTSTVSRPVGEASATTSAIVLPEAPLAIDLDAPLGATGEVLLTGSIELPDVLAATGAVAVVPPTDADDRFDDEHVAHTSTNLQPVPASAVASQHALGTPIVSEPRPRVNRALTALLITAAGLAVVVTGLVVVAIVLKWI